MGYEYSAAEHMASFCIVCRWERTYNICCTLMKACRIYVNKPARQMAHLK